jgi:hypothetical protein
MEAGTANVRRMFLLGSESVGLMMVGGIYDAWFSLLYIISTTTRNLNPETKEIYFFI